MTFPTKDTPLNVPGNCYTSTESCLYTDAIGQQWVTSMSDARLTPRVFGVHLWYRKTYRSAWQIVQALPLCHGWLSIDRGRLRFTYNLPDMRGTNTRIIAAYKNKID